jgi:hypothetical protein
VSALGADAGLGEETGLGADCGVTEDWSDIGDVADCAETGDTGEAVVCALVGESAVVSGWSQTFTSAGETALSNTGVLAETSACAAMLLPRSWGIVALSATAAPLPRAMTPREPVAIQMFRFFMRGVLRCESAVCW